MDFHGNKLTTSAHIPIVSHDRTGWAQGSGRAGLLGALPGLDGVPLTGKALIIARGYLYSDALHKAAHAHRWADSWDPAYRPGQRLPDRGARHYDRGTARLAWILLSRADVDAHAAETGLTPTDAACDLSGFWARYGGPGRGYASAPHARLTSRRVLVTQWSGLDI